MIGRGVCTNQVTAFYRSIINTVLFTLFKHWFFLFFMAELSSECVATVSACVSVWGSAIRTSGRLSSPLFSFHLFSRNRQLYNWAAWHCCMICRFQQPPFCPLPPMSHLSDVQHRLANWWLPQFALTTNSISPDGVIYNLIIADWIRNEEGELNDMATNGLHSLTI